MTRRRWALGALAAAVVVWGAEAYAAARLEDYVAVGRVTPAAFAAAFALAAAGGWLWRPRWQVVATAALPALLVAYVTAGLALHVDRPALHVVRRVVAPGGGFEVLVGYSYDWLADPGWEARVRTGSGLLTRERVVWSRYLPGLEGARVDVRVTGPHTIEVSAGGQVDAVTF